MKKKTLDEFILDACKVHGDKYDYSKVEYVNNKTKVCITCLQHGEFLQKPNSHLNGQGCPDCAKTFLTQSSRKTKGEFIEDAIKVHGIKYDYQKVEYTNAHTLVKIDCPVHGEFEQIPASHLNGSGCPRCGIISRSIKQTYTFDEFKTKAVKIHGQKYEYIPNLYKDTKTKIGIVCPIHGIFYQTPHSHLRGRGCPRCAGKNKNTEIFINEAHTIHKDKYDYSKVEYRNSATKVCIVCPEHGEFWQTPHDHLYGYGCPKCKNDRIKMLLTSNTEEFIKKAIEIHKDRYDYSEVEYKKATVPVKIICQKHGSFYQKPSLHLSGHNCPKCSESKGEIQISKWLQDHNINYISQFVIYPKEIVLFGRNKFRVDFFLKNENTIIEFHGIQHYQRQFCWHTEEQFQEQQDRDLRLRRYCKQNKIRLIEIPYTDIDNIDAILKKKLLKSK